MCVLVLVSACGGEDPGLEISTDWFVLKARLLRALCIGAVYSLQRHHVL